MPDIVVRTSGHWDKTLGGAVVGFHPHRKLASGRHLMSPIISRRGALNEAQHGHSHRRWHMSSVAPVVQWTQVLHSAIDSSSCDPMCAYLRPVQTPSIKSETVAFGRWWLWR
eukprot:5114096-Amphidinium_carterae.1